MKRKRGSTIAMEEDARDHDQQDQQDQFKQNADICQQLLDRYSSSAAPQHRHLLAIAAATRSILNSESLSLTPHSYFAAAVTALDNTSADPTATAALLSFLSIVIPLVPPRGITSSKASEAVGILVEVLEREAGLGVSSVRALVKCLGILVVEFCDLEDWNLVKVGFETLLKFSVDRRPKVRRCAQGCLEKIIKSIQCTSVIKHASKMVLSFCRSYMPMALTLSTSRPVDGSKDEGSPKPEHLEVLHLLSVLNLVVPYLSYKASAEVLSKLQNLFNARFSVLTKHILGLFETLLETSKVKMSTIKEESLITSLISYVSEGENPIDTVIAAANLIKYAVNKLSRGDSRSWNLNLPLISTSLAGLLTSESSTAQQAARILVDLINNKLDLQTHPIDENQLLEDRHETMEMSAIKSACTIIENALCACDEIPNEHILEVISALFIKLGNMSGIFMKNILLKLSDMMNSGSQEASNFDNLQKCVGSAMTAMGPERILKLIPISLSADEFTCHNTWLIPILKNYVGGASLGYYMNNIVPLAKAFQQAGHKVKKRALGQDLEVYSKGLLALLPAFCRRPTDTCQVFESLSEFMINSLKQDSFMHESIAVALKTLVNENRCLLVSDRDACQSDMSPVRESVTDLRAVPSYSKKTAAKNITALASHSSELLQALTDSFIDSLPGKRTVLKDAIGCLASISDSCETFKIFKSLLKRLQFLDGETEHGHLGDAEVGKEHHDVCRTEKDIKRCVVMELASCLVEGAKEDLVYLIYEFVKHTLMDTKEIAHSEAYQALRRILEEHAWFCSSKFFELTDFILGLNCPVNVESLRKRFAIYHMLLVNGLQMGIEDESAKAFLIFNEIIVALKDAKEDTRKAAYDTLLNISSSLRKLPSVESDPPYHKLIHMILGYLSGSSPHIKSGAVSALSVLVYSDTDICLSLPNLVPSVLSLLQSKAVEVIKAVLGFVKVFVSGLEAEDLHNFLNDVVSGVLPWSSVSRHHFRSKVTVILEIMIRKCGYATIQSETPEKYKGFVKTVSQNRHGKTGAKHSSHAATETNNADHSTEGVSKKRKEPSDSAVAIGLRKQRKRGRERGHNSSAANSNGPSLSAGSDGQSRYAKKAKNSDHEEGWSKGISKEKKSFKRKFSGGAKGKKQQGNTNRQTAVPWKRSSKPSKNGRMRKTEKRNNQ